MFSTFFRQACFFLCTSILLTGCNLAFLPDGDSGLLQTAAAGTLASLPTSGAVVSPPGPSASPVVKATTTQQPQITPLLTLTTLTLAPTEAAGSSTPDLRPSPLPLFTATVMSTPISRQLCDRAAPGVPLDVTIPDDTNMRPGEAFTKIWRLENIGTCTWTTNYTLSFFSGHDMSAPLVLHLRERVAPGETVDLAVDMVSPLTGGRYQGNWKLQNDSAEWFGIGPLGDSVFWARIQVIAPPTPTDTPTPTHTFTPTPTLTLTPTPTPTPDEPATLVLPPGSVVDLLLRSLELESGTGDLHYELVSSAEGVHHQLTPLAGAQLGVPAPQLPTLEECRAATLGALPLVVDTLTPGDTFCYITKSGTYGWARVSALSPVDNLLTLQLLNFPQEP